MNNIFRNASLGFIVGLTVLATGCLDGMDEGLAPDAHVDGEMAQPRSPRFPDLEPTRPPRDAVAPAPVPSSEGPVEPCSAEELDLLANHEQEWRARRGADPLPGQECLAPPWDEDPAEPTIDPQPKPQVQQ